LYWKISKRILRYIAGTVSYGSLYSNTKKNCLIADTDSDFVGSLDDRKITSGYIFHLGSGSISWASKKQPIVTISSIEDEYVAATTVWLHRVLKELQQG
jgi:hypothetical protein